MIRIGSTIVSLDVIEKRFFCDMEKCRGMCCVHGISGAPLEEVELEIIEQVFPVFMKYLNKSSKKSVDAQGIYVIDSDGEYVTPLNNGKECAYAVFENGIARCAIEKAFDKGEINYRKPLSCHLYPVRITKYPDFEAVNFDDWEICSRTLKQDDAGIPVYRFVKDALIRKYGAEWYRKLEQAAEQL